MFLLPKIIQFFHHSSPKVRESAIFCINQFLNIRCDILLMHFFDSFIAALYQHASDEAAEVRRRVCQSLVLVLDTRPEAIIPEIDNIVKFMLFCIQQEDETIALEACEFWLSFAELNELMEYLQPYVKELLPLLLRNMVYDQETIIMLESLNEDMSVPDNVQDIKPRHHKAKIHAQEVNETGSEQDEKSGRDNDESDYDEDDEDEDDFDMEWSVRKCSAATLDVLSVTFGDVLLPDLLPAIQENMLHPSWERRECGILALGAISEGIC